MAKRTGAESLAVDVYQRLRVDILRREFAPGERLLPVELGQRFGVSLGVMREALGMLSAQSLVRVERNRGFHVTPLTPAALTDLRFALKVNGGSALRLSVEHGDVAWESEVLAAHHRMASDPVRQAAGGQSASGSAVAHLAFHRSLIASCGNDLLLSICDRLSDAAELYRAWSGEVGGQERDAAGEHRSLLEAALDHDPDLAVKLFEAHVDQISERGAPCASSVR